MMSTLRFLRKFQRTPDFTFCKTKYLQRFFCGGNDGNLWEDDFTRPVPEFDWDYLCKDENLKEIEENVINRKGVGDIHKVRSLWKQIGTENDASKKEILQSELLKAAAELPNRTSPTSPIGHEEMATVEETLGEKKEFTFKPQSVVEIGSRLGLLRTQDVGHTTGPRTYYFISDFAKLEQALIKYTLRKILPQGFTLVSVPDIINSNIIEACGFKTSGERNQVYKLDPRYHDDLCLAGTSEMSLAGFFMNEVLDEKDLPKKVCAVSRCYRAETSALEEGIYRVHQFTKVEMFGVTHQDGGENLLEELLEIEKELFCGLGLHFRILNMPTHELGAPAYKKYDIESWMPAKQFWGEISSASNCTDYQSRRLNIKYKNSEGKLTHAETVNGTACAIPRLIMALTENFQEENGNVAIPSVLQHYMSGQTHLRKHQKKGKMKFITGKHGV